MDEVIFTSLIAWISLFIISSLVASDYSHSKNLIISSFSLLQADIYNVLVGFKERIGKIKNHT